MVGDGVGFAAERGEAAMLDQHHRLGAPATAELTWSQYGRLVEAVDNALEPRPPMRSFAYRHAPVGDDGGKPYEVPLSYFDAGGGGEPVVAVGGLVNVVQRFEFMALDALPELRLIALDLAGRGRSGWLRDIEDYGLDTYVEQLAQCLDRLGIDACTLCGSSLGGSIAIRYAARNPERVRRIVLNDSAPFIPVERRARRARAVARHYVFSSPHQMIRRTGAASKPFGPVPESVLLHTCHYQTRWSDTEDGRVYRHDLRAMEAYRVEARASLDLWREWEAIRCPVLLLHGELSDATSEKTIDRMRRHDGLSVLHVADTGHTPPLCDGTLTRRVVDWVLDDTPFAEDGRHQPPTLSARPVFADAA